MEKVEHIVITRKESKDLAKLQRLLEIMRVDPVKMAGEIIELQHEVNELKKKNALLEEDLKNTKTEMIELIRKELQQIAANVQKATAKEGSGNKANMNFKGKTIDESYQQRQEACYHER